MFEDVEVRQSRARKVDGAGRYCGCSPTNLRHTPSPQPYRTVFPECFNALRPRSTLNHES